MLYIGNMGNNTLYQCRYDNIIKDTIIVVEIHWSFQYEETVD